MRNTAILRMEGWLVGCGLTVLSAQTGYIVPKRTRSSADADKPARCVYRSVKVTKHSTIP